MLRLRDAGGNELATNDDVSGGSGNLFSEITYTALVSGDFYLDVTGFDTDTGTFFLTATSPVADTVAGSAPPRRLSPSALRRPMMRYSPQAIMIGLRYRWLLGKYMILTTANGGGANIDTTLMLRNASGPAGWL